MTSHIDWREKRVPARTLGPEGVPHRLEKETSASKNAGI